MLIIDPKTQLKRVLFCVGFSVVVSSTILIFIWLFKDSTKDKNAELNVVTVPEFTTTTISTTTTNNTADIITSTTKRTSHASKSSKCSTNNITGNTSYSATTRRSNTSKISKGNLIISTVESVTEPIMSVTERVTNNDKSATTTVTTTSSLSNLTYTKYTPTEQEMIMMCTVVCSETGYCDVKNQSAVAHTIVNRVYSNNFPNTVYEVVTQRNQYSCISRYFSGNMRKGCEIGSENWKRSMQVCIDAWNEYDFTNGATAYYNPYMNGYNAWFEQFQLVYEDEYGRFFKA